MKRKVLLTLKVLVVLSFIPFVLSGCIAAVPYAIYAGAGAVGAAAKASKVKDKGPQKSQLEIRELQTRTYEVQDSKMVLKTMLNVLQDDGFVITEANTDLGLLSASKELDVQTKGAVFWGTFIGGTWDKNATVEATANVTEFGKQTRVRVNFQQKVNDSSGGVARVEVIEEATFYRNFSRRWIRGFSFSRKIYR